MRKKVLSAVLAATMVAGMMGNVVSVSAEECQRGIYIRSLKGKRKQLPDSVDRKSTRLNSSHPK